MSSRDDHEAALGAVAAGDLRALEVLYRALRVPVFALALSVVRDRSLAEDVLHETFVRVYEKAHSYRPGTRPRAWILAIARNLAIDAARGRAQHSAFDGGPSREDEPLEAMVVTDALLKLEPLERQIVALHALGGLTHAQVASLLELPQGTVRWKYRVALGHLAPHLTGQGDA